MTKHWYVQSNTHPEDRYEVTYLKERGWMCDCIGYLFRASCSHIHQVQEMLKSRIEYAGKW